jgi:outer membrane protein assembly factor BamA
VLAAHGWLVASDTADGRFVPFYLQPSLGGANTLRSFTNYRFHDRNMLVLNIETRVAVLTHMDAAVFLDAGNVAPRVGELNLDKRSYGAGVRFHSRRNTFARVEVANGADGWRFLFRLNDPLSLSRLLRRTAPVPFVP